MPGITRPTTKARELRRNATPAERALWVRINKSQLGAKFSRQMPVGPYICDFLCRSAMLVVELDGYSHDLTVEDDAARDAFLRSRGLRVLRFTNADVHERLEGVVLAIRDALGGCPPPGPLPPAGAGA